MRAHTFSGAEFDPYEPTADVIDIRDIAAALSNINRFIGHTEYPYSVAQHSVLVARMVPAPVLTPPTLTLAALLHDAHEAYLGDMSAPLKAGPVGDAIRPLERKWNVAIAEHFDFDPVLFDHPSIKLADRVASRLEILSFMHPSVTSTTVTDFSSDVLLATDRALAGGVKVAPALTHGDAYIMFTKTFNQLMAGCKPVVRNEAV